jgi:hypothetical protein
MLRRVAQHGGNGGSALGHPWALIEQFGCLDQRIDIDFDDLRAKSLRAGDGLSEQRFGGQIAQKIALMRQGMPMRAVFGLKPGTMPCVRRA